MKRNGNIKKVLFLVPLSVLQWKEAVLLFIIVIGAMGFCLFVLVPIESRYRQPRWISSAFRLAYILLISYSNSYFAYRLSTKQAKANFIIAGIYIALIAIQNGIFYYLYSAQFLASVNSLFVLALVSWGIAFVCVKIWILISNRSK